MRREESRVLALMPAAYGEFADFQHSHEYLQYLMRRAEEKEIKRL
jgi:hypothetical protein